MASSKPAGGEGTAEVSDFSTPFDISEAPKGRFAMETRAESTRVVTGGDVVRRGEMNHITAGGMGSFADAVAGEEDTRIRGTLTERVSHGSRIVANEIETTVNGRLSISAVGWKESKLSGEDGFIMGGALTDTWTGGLLIASAMSDDLVVGAGVRVTSPVDVWLNQLTGMEERPGTAAADGLMIDLCGTLFEREYGAGGHVAGLAVLNGTVYQTQRVGFRPMMKTAMGVRNLIPGSGTPASEQPPPSPPPAGVAPVAGAGVGVLAGATAGSVATARSIDNFQDMGRVAGTADEMQNAASLRHADDTASTLEETSTAARTLELPTDNPARIEGADIPNGMGPGELEGAQMPNGMGSADLPPANTTPDDWVSPLSELDLQRAQLPADFNRDEMLRRLDELTSTWLGRVEWGREEQLAAANSQIGYRLETLNDLGRHAAEFEVTPLPPKGGPPPVMIHNPGLGDAGIVVWPSAFAKGDDARVAQVESELDALMALRGALEDGVDPMEQLRALAAQTEELYGATDPRTVAFTDAIIYFEELADVTRYSAYQTELDVLMLMRSELLAGRNPRVAAESFLESFETGADAQRADIVNFLAGPEFDVAVRTPEGMDNSNLANKWSAQAAELRRQAQSIDVTTPAGAERASALSEVAGVLDNAAFEVMVGNDPTNMLLRNISQIEARVFSDGSNGANDAANLRLAWQEYSVQVDRFREVILGESSLDAPGIRRAAGTTDMSRGAANIADLGPVPDYPGLPEEFSLQELRLNIDPPSYADEFPAGVPDEFRQLLDLEPEQATEAVTAPVRNWNLPSGNPGLLDVYEGPPVASLPPVEPRLDDAGSAFGGVGGGATASDEAVTAVNNAAQPIGNYQAMDGASNAVMDLPVTVSDDTEAVVSGMPVAAVPDDFKWTETVDSIKSQYLDYRRSSNWRGALVYEEALEGMRDDLLKAFTDLGGNVDDVPSRDHGDLRRAIQGLLDEANQAGDADQAKRASDFLESLDRETNDLLADLVKRGDEFESAARGQIQPLDAHVDQSKLLAWLRSQQTDAMNRMDDLGDPAAKIAASHEATYWQQMVLAMERGINPLTESGDQIAYLRRSAPDQAEIYEAHHSRLVATLSDPAFHKSAAEMGDATYAPVAFLRPELGNVPANGEGMQSQVFIAEVVEPEGQGAEVSTGNYDANSRVINKTVGDTDFARAPDEQPKGILKNAADGGGNLDFDLQRTVNQEPTEYTDEGMHEWVRGSAGTRPQARLDSIAAQGTVANYMDELVASRPSQLQAQDSLAKNPYAAARKDAATLAWSDMPTGPAFPQRRTVRFGNADVLEVVVDAEDAKAMHEQKDLMRAKRKLKRQGLTLAETAAQFGDGMEFPWWTGTGINRATEPLNTDNAIRHVPTPRMEGDGRMSSWRASRQPGFGRLADGPGEFPFSTREQMMADLMQGQRVDARHIDALQGTLSDAVRADRVRHKEWLDMTALLRSLRYGVVLGDSSRPFAQALDWRTLAKMLDMLESAASMA